MKDHEFPRKPRFALQALLVALVLFVLFFVWMAVFEVQESTNVPGVIEPSLGNAPVQHPSGGLIRELLVKEGDHVEAGQVLARIEALDASASLERQIEQEIILMAQRARLVALVAGTQPDFTDIPPGYEELVENQRQLHLRESASRSASLAVLDNKAEELQLKVRSLESEQVSMAKQKLLQEEELAIQRGLAKDGLVPRTQIIALERQYETFIGRYNQNPIDRDQTLAEIAGLEKQRNEYVQNLRRTYSENLARVDEELRLVRAQLGGGLKVSSRLEISSPQAGMVNGLRKKRTGEILKPNELLLEVIPDHSAYVAKVRIPSHRIGYIEKGMEVMIVPDAYRQEPDATMRGSLVEISSGTLMDVDNNPYFEGTVVLPVDQLVLGGKPFALLSGMSVQAAITTGRKTLLRYIFGTVIQSANFAFRER